MNICQADCVLGIPQETMMKKFRGECVYNGSHHFLFQSRLSYKLVHANYEQVRWISISLISQLDRLLSLHLV